MAFVVGNKVTLIREGNWHAYVLCIMLIRLPHTNAEDY